MTDNIAVTPGSGATVATDDVGGFHHQRVKVVWGPDGTVNDADVASGKALPVQMRVSDGTAWTYGAGSTTAGTPRIVLASDSVNDNGQATAANSAPVVPASNWVYGTGKHVAVAASQTDAVIQATTGATGDYLDHVVVVPATTAAGVVTIKDNTTAVISYPGGGTTALLTLTPFTIYVGAVSASGAWKITTGANVSVLAVGRFS